MMLSTQNSIPLQLVLHMRVFFRCLLVQTHKYLSADHRVYKGNHAYFAEETGEDSFGLRRKM